MSLPGAKRSLVFSVQHDMTNTRKARHGKSFSDAGPAQRRLTLSIVITYLFLPLTFLIPLAAPARESHFDLNSWFALLAYAFTETGGTAGASVIGTLLLLLLVTRAGVPGRRRRLEAGVIFSVVAILAGGGAAFNEYVIKPTFKMPRPHIRYLAGNEGSGPLGMTVNEFYALEDRETRRERLRTVLEADPPPVRLPRLIREHWIEVTGYSFPSGHSLSAMFFATFFMAMGLTYLSMPRRLFCYLLLPWAVCVCYSRFILGVHTPTDISVGGLEGLLLGALAFVLVKRAWLLQSAQGFGETASRA